MPMSLDLASTFTRYNSGKHFMDSGGESGRHWQRPILSALLTMDDDGECTISLTHLLSEHATQVIEAQEIIEDAYDDDPTGGIFDVPPEAMEAAGYTLAARGNTYNGDNDLSQDFVYEVWLPEDRSDEWYYSDDAVVLIYCHTGADIRGGYAKALAVQFDGELTIPDVRVSYYCEATGAQVESTYGLDIASVSVEDFTVTTPEGEVFTADYWVS